MDDFAHLHIHSEFSLLDGAIAIKDLIKITKEYNMSSMSITDHGSLAGTLEFFREAKKEKIKPILGCEVYVTNDEDGLPNEEKHRDNYHMILLASNEIGWKNLMYLNSNAYQNNFYYKPRISMKNLLSHGEGLIGNSACLAGLCSQHAAKDPVTNYWYDQDNKVRDLIGQMKEAFSGNYYLELMDSNQPEQIAYNKFLIEMAAKTDTKLIITADAHYTKREDEELHTALMCMQSKKSIEEYKQDGYWHYENCYVRPPNEMLDSALRVGAESAYWNTLEVAEKCNLDIKLGEYKMPLFDLTSDPEWNQYCEEIK